MPDQTQPSYTLSLAPPLTIPPSITAVLDNFANIFAEPHQLPPIRTITHHVHLFPNTSPLMLNLTGILITRRWHWRKKSWRCYVDYYALNAITIKDHFSMPTIDELGQVAWFSKLNLRQGFHQIWMAEEDIPKTTFHTHHNHYEFKVMSFGLCNAPSTLQAMMNKVLRPFTLIMTITNSWLCFFMIY